MLRNLKPTLLLIFATVSMYAQVGVGTTTPAGALDITSTNDGLLIPRVALTNSTTATVTSPTKSELVYNTATAGDVTPGYYYWETTPTVASDRWIRLVSAIPSNNWSITGNTGTTAGTNFVGTTDAVDFATRTNNIERMRVLSNGRIAVNATTLSQADNQFEVTSTIVGDDAITGIAVGTGGRGVQGNSTLDGIGVFGFNPDTGVGIFGSSATTGIGTYGNNSGTSTGVWGNNNNATASQDGFGVIGNITSTTSIGVGVQGQIDSPTGNAIVGINNLGTAIMGQTIDPTQTSSTAAVYGTLDRTTNGAGINQDISAVIGSTRSLEVGTGGYAGPLAAATNSSISGVAGSVASRVTNANTDSYLFGVIGDVLRDSSVGTSTIPDRTGGVMGYNGSNAWGVLGYRNSAGTGFGTYAGLIAANIGGGAGKSSSTNKTPNNGIGIGTTGGFMGGFIKGEQYGLISKGEEFGLYVTGNTITNSPIIKLTENNNERVATYVPTSTSIDINTRGKGKLSNGETFVTFDKNFIASASLDTENINITITPTGATNGVYIDRVTKTGFYVKENLKGTSNASFNWTAISTQKGFENGVSLSKEILANDFDKKMDGVMYNEADTTGEATPIHFDGNKVLFERMPEDTKNMKSDAPVKKLKRVILPESVDKLKQ